MSKIDKTAADGTEYREDGSKIATEDSPSGETATENISRKESRLPNGGRAPEYDEGEEADERDVVAPSPPTGA